MVSSGLHGLKLLFVSHLSAVTNLCSLHISTDVWGSSDQFHFDKHSVAGDLTVEMRVDSFEVEHYWGAGGLMGE